MLSPQTISFRFVEKTDTVGVPTDTPMDPIPERMNDILSI